MKRYFKVCLFSASILLLISTGFVAESPAQDAIGTILRRMDAHNKVLTSVQADVTMVKYNPQLNVSDVYTGKTSYLPKTKTRVRYMRLDWLKPAVEQVALIGDNYELYKPSTGTLFYGQVTNAKNNASAGNALSFMNMSKDELKANYDVSFVGDEQISGNIRTVHLLLVPKSAASYKSADIWVDLDGMPRQGRQVEKNDDTTTILLTNIQKNVTLKGEIFKLKPTGKVDRKRV